MSHTISISYGKVITHVKSGEKQKQKKKTIYHNPHLPPPPLHIFIIPWIIIILLDHFSDSQFFFRITSLIITPDSDNDFKSAYTDCTLSDCLECESLSALRNNKKSFFGRYVCYCH